MSIPHMILVLGELAVGNRVLCTQFWEFLDQKRGSAVANGSCKAIATLVASLHTTWVACELKAHRAIVLHMNAYKNIQRILRFRTRRF